MEWIAKVVEVIKLPLKYIWLLAIASWALLFLPTSFLNKLHIVYFAKTYATYIGVVFLCSVILVAINLLAGLWRFISGKLRYNRFSQQRQSALMQLDPKEKAVLREFTIQQQTTLTLPINHPTVSGLLTKGILVQVGSYGEQSLAGLLFPVGIDDDIRGQLTATMIDFPESEPTPKMIDFIRSSRPDFIFEVEEHQRIFHTSWRRPTF